MTTMALKLRSCVPLKLALAAGMAALVFGVALPTSVEAKNRFVFANESDFDTMDPHAAFDNVRVAVRLNLYDGLMRWQDNPAKLNPWVADTYTISPDGLAYRFTMKRGVKFHDGSEVKAVDVVYSMERILAMNKGAATIFKRMIGPGQTRAVDAYTVEFKLAKPSAIFLSMVPELHIVNKALVQKNEKDKDWGAQWLSKNDAGSGAFKLKQYDPALGFVADRFVPHFKGWGKKYLDEIEFRGVKDANTRVLGLQKGDFSGVGGYHTSDQLKTLREGANTKVLESESMRVMLVHIHNQRAPLNDVHVRRAINYAFDYDGFNKDILGGMVERNVTPLPNNIWGIPKDAKGYYYDTEKAKAELAQAKVKVDRPLEIAHIIGFSQSEQAAALLQNGLKKIGIESKLVGVPWPSFVQKVAKQETSADLSVLWVSTFYADPHNWIGEMYHSGGWGTYLSNSFYKNPKVDDLLDKALRSTKQAERAKLYEEATRIVVDEAASVWIYNTKWFGPYAKNLQGVRFSPVGNGQEMRTVYFE
ncbi:MAG: ABC transporter substrate-binding protein [Candidatus Rokubacteria bacterium]|nr:ABC transporter substrate-binding protein [Candidatus Rokubacteria bacterium]MBI3104511.1 ABC transporter substrate-binding protein [Candidatus Rokubacteria bacterium]